MRTSREWATQPQLSPSPARGIYPRPPTRGITKPRGSASPSQVPRSRAHTRIRPRTNSRGAHYRWEDEPRQPIPRCVEHLLTLLVRTAKEAVSRIRPAKGEKLSALDEKEVKRFFQIVSRGGK